MIDLDSLMPGVAAFSASRSRETAFIGAALSFSMTKEKCGLSFINWNLSYATAAMLSLKHRKKHVGQYLKLFNLFGDELKQFELCLCFLVLLAIFPLLFCIVVYNCISTYFDSS